MNTKQEIAKFATRVTARETIVHIILGTIGLLPITWYVLTITPTINTIQIILSAIISVLLAYYAWGKK